MASEGEIGLLAEIRTFAIRCIDEWGINFPPVVLELAG
jgi:hypothetical protein